MGARQISHLVETHAPSLRQTPAVNNGGHAITFKPWANKQLRAATTAADITDFRLLAWEDAGSMLIDGSLVAGSGSSWTYSPIAFWPEATPVNFYAFSPAGSSGVTNALAGQTDPPSIDYELPGHSANTTTTLAGQEDLLVTNHTGTYATEGARGVTLNFRHALSRILIQAKSEGLNEFVVMGVTLKNIKSSGTLDLSLVPKDATAFPYPTDNATVASPGYQTFWDTSGGSDGDLVANIPISGDTVRGSVYTDIIGNDDALADSGDKSKEQYQGVFFKWGSLVGVSPNGGPWSPQRAYVPDITAIDGSWSEDDTMPWASIPYIDTDPGVYGRNNSYLTDVTEANIAALVPKGDICVYLTKIGAAPKGKRWRMPTMNEYALLSTAGEYVRNPTTGGFQIIGATNDDGTSPISSGYDRAVSNRPYFPISGFRVSAGGLASSTEGYYWSSSSADPNQAHTMRFLSSGINTSWFYVHPVATPVRCVVE
ncbi:hypothetical protein FACS1894160_2220 [Bacteroidia bacterium]|nr:hypothetical protein FACS1894160_2220 [Bacteroidia bacterium]